MTQEAPAAPRMDLDALRASTSAVVSIANAARVLDLDERTVRRGCEAGDLPCVRVGRRLLIPRLPFLALLGANPADMDEAGIRTPASATTHEAVKEPRHDQYAAGTARSA